MPPKQASTLDDPLTRRIIACAIEVHKRLGPGLLEKLYKESMVIEMELCGLKVEKNVKVAVEYRGKPIGEYFIDILVENAVILELKSVERHDPVFEAQILSYMKLTDKKVGLLINFNSKMVKDGIRRFVL
ncbi:MAG TPA: GxxExxY protein [Anaerolineales bacterium]|nr:GxxExxY protein [Anaerolineales bacterium]